MPTYCYKANDGTPFEMTCPISRYPGETLEANGKTYKRDYAAEQPQVSAAVAGVVHKYPYVSSVLERFHPDCDHTPIGKSIVRSQAHERFLMSKYGYRRD